MVAGHHLKNQKDVMSHDIAESVSSLKCISRLPFGF